MGNIIKVNEEIRGAATLIAVVLCAEDALKMALFYADLYKEKRDIPYALLADYILRATYKEFKK